MSEPYLVKKSERFQNLSEERLHQFQWKTLVLIELDEVVQRFSKRFKDHAEMIMVVEGLKIPDNPFFLHWVPSIYFLHDLLLGFG